MTGKIREHREQILGTDQTKFENPGRIRTDRSRDLARSMDPCLI